MRLQGCLLLLVSIGVVQAKRPKGILRNRAKRTIRTYKSGITTSRGSDASRGKIVPKPRPLQKHVRFDLPSLTTEEDHPVSTKLRRQSRSETEANSLVHTTDAPGDETILTENHSKIDLIFPSLVGQIPFFDNITQAISLRQSNSRYRSGPNRAHAKKPQTGDVTSIFVHNRGEDSSEPTPTPSPKTPPETKPIVPKEKLVTSRMVIYTMAVLLTIIVMGTCIYMVLVAFAL